jgi:excisionase family DNA binding protein
MKGNVERPLVFIINRPAVSEQKNCSKCNEGSGLITPDEAAALAGVSTRVIYRRLEDGEIHFIENARGELFICVKTLVANMNN